MALLGARCRAAGVAVWAYCLMPNHVHLIPAPMDEGWLLAAARPGHGANAITLDIYRHVLEDQETRVADRIDNIFSGKA